jgi:hypothetical protein
MTVQTTQIKRSPGEIIDGPHDECASVFPALSPPVAASVGCLLFGGRHTSDHVDADGGPGTFGA